MNSSKLTNGEYLELAKTVRAAETFELQSNIEILCWDAPDNSGAGSVVQLGVFKSKNKQTGAEAKTSAVTLATVGVVNGKRVLLELAETIKPE